MAEIETNTISYPVRMACPACDGVMCTTASHIPDHPSFMFPMSMTGAVSVKRAPLSLQICHECGHIFQSAVDHGLIKQIYQDYYADYPYDTDEAMIEPYRVPFLLFTKLILESHCKDQGVLVEIGCSKVENLIPFASLGFRCIGIDPSPLSGNFATPDKNIKIFEGYYETTQVNEKVNVIVSRFNLEHIVDVSSHVQKMFDDLQDGGLVFIQVPNIELWLENGQPLFAAHEHPQYFCLASLCALFKRFGFSMVSFYSSGQPSIIACFEKTDKAVTVTTPNFYEKFSLYRDAVSRKREELLSLLNSSSPVIAYGCGLTLFWLLSELPHDFLSNLIVVDDNPALHGKYLPAYVLPVQAPTPDLFEAGATVILTLNSIYHPKVVERLKRLQSTMPIRVLALGVDEIGEFILDESVRAS